MGSATYAAAVPRSPYFPRRLIEENHQLDDGDTGMRSTKMVGAPGRPMPPRSNSAADILPGSMSHRRWVPVHIMSTVIVALNAQLLRRVRLAS
jgi:hypothetical protein